MSCTWRGGHAAGHRDDGAAQPLRAVVRAQPAGEQAVAVGVVHMSPGGRRRRGSTAPRPSPRRRGRSSCSRRRSACRSCRTRRGRARSGPRHGEHAERVVVAQVGLAGVREPREVGELAAVVGVDAGGVEGGPVVRHVRRRRGAASSAAARAGAPAARPMPIRSAASSEDGSGAEPSRRVVSVVVDRIRRASVRDRWAVAQLQTARSVTNRAGGWAVKRGTGTSASPTCVLLRRGAH